MALTIVFMPSGQTLKNISLEDLSTVIKDLISQDKELGVFTIAMTTANNEIFSLQLFSNLTVKYDYCRNSTERISVDYEIRGKVRGCEQAKELYALLLDSKFEEVKNRFLSILVKEDYDFSWMAKSWQKEKEEKNKLETFGDLILTYSLTGDDNEEKIKVIMESWEEVEELYVLFLDSKFDSVRNILRNKIDSKS